MQIDERGDIRLHGQEGLRLVFQFTDENGDPQDVSANIYKFKTEYFEKSLTSGVTTAEKILQINEGELTPEHLNKRVGYIITDESGIVPQVILSAQIAVSGW